MVIAERVPTLTVAAAARRLRAPSEGTSILLLTLVAYLATSSVAVFHFGIVTAQALGQVANASYVVLSRDPHLAALGFVGSPMPALLLIPLVALHGLWPALTQAGFAAVLLSALFSAGAVYQLHQLLVEAGVSRGLRLAVVGLFALHPLVLYIAITGMAEAGYLFFLLMAVRRLMRWLRAAEPADLVTAGLALAGAYLTRYDALVAGVAAGALVALVTHRRSKSEPGWAAMCDLALVAAPLLAVAAVWSGASWLLTGSVFPQLSSSYGYVAQLQAFQGHSGPLVGSELTRTLAQVLALAPALPAVLVLGALAVFRRRPASWAAAAAVLGPVTGGIVVAGLLNWTFPWLRLLIPLVALTAVVIALGVVPAAAPGDRARRRAAWPAMAAVAMLAAGIPTSLAAMSSPLTGREETPVLQSLGLATARPAAGAFESARTVAAYLDRQRLGEGAVLVDSFTGFPVIDSVADPRRLLITSDRDFALAVTSPASFGVRFVLVPAPAYLGSLGALDAINRAYPALFASGHGSGALVREFKGPSGRVEWRLYSVAAFQPVPSPSAAPGS